MKLDVTNVWQNLHSAVFWLRGGGSDWSQRPQAHLLHLHQTQHEKNYLDNLI